MSYNLFPTAASDHSTAYFQNLTETPVFALYIDSRITDVLR
jgi:hypothetical protein